LKRVYDVGAALGGPIKRDTLWFFTAHRWWGGEEYQTGVFYNATQSTLFYTPDLSRPGYSRAYEPADNIKETWKDGDKTQFTFGEINQPNCGCFYFMGPNRAPEAGQSYYFVPSHLIQSTWTFPASNRLLFEAGSSLRIDGQTIERPPEVSPSDIAAFDQRLD